MSEERYDISKSPLRKTVLQPCCMNHCRDWRETAGGLPASNHSPSCEHYKPETFFQVTLKCEKGPWCILETQAEVDAMIEDTEAEFDVKTVMMTRDQFEHLDEFEGF